MREDSGAVKSALQSLKTAKKWKGRLKTGFLADWLETGMPRFAEIKKNGNALSKPVSYTRIAGSSAILSQSKINLSIPNQA